jgi:phage-related minor tail protein
MAQGKSAIDSIGGALSSVFGSLAKRVLKQFEDAIFSSLQGSGGQGLGGMLSGLLGSLGGGGGKSSGGNNPSAFVGGSSGFNWGSLLGMFGFARGGYTGEGDKYEYAGPAHKGEFYYTKAEVAKMGLPFFYGMKNHIQSGSKAGFAEGGYTGGGSYSGGGLASVMQKSFSPTINNQMDFNPAMYFDLADLARELGKHPQFGRDVVSVVGKNSSKLGINR